MSISVTVEVELDDIDDDDLITEIEGRGYVVLGSNQDNHITRVVEVARVCGWAVAANELRDQLIADGLLPMGAQAA